MNIDVNNGSYSHSELGSLHVKDFTSDYGHMGRGWRLPTVALSTASTRLGNVKTASVGAKQYETHDDLVMTVSVPTEYRDDDLYLNSITKIFTFEGGSAQQLFLTFINSDEDSFYYRYAGTYTTYSAPVLYAVMQAPPYYREANTVTNIKFSITTGVSNYDKLKAIPYHLNGRIARQLCTIMFQ